ncbi:protein E30 [Elephant endotheliotropic herpesvirus 5B]|nr:protein E30 [Elephant endotheliotropic herpesvirus 5B]
MLLLIPMLITALTGSSRAESGSGFIFKGSGEDPRSTSDDEDYDQPPSEVTNYLGVDYTDENVFTPSPSFPPEAYNVSNEPLTELPPEPEDGFYISSDGSGGGYSDDEDEKYEVQFLEKAFELKDHHTFK